DRRDRARRAQGDARGRSGPGGRRPGRGVHRRRGQAGQGLGGEGRQARGDGGHANAERAGGRIRGLGHPRRQGRGDRSGSAESRVVVIGNSLFAANGYFRLSGNKDFALNAVSWVAKEESRISIRPKQRQGNHLFLSAEQKRTMTLFAFDLLPFGLLFAGLVV